MAYDDRSPRHMTVLPPEGDRRNVLKYQNDRDDDSHSTLGRYDVATGAFDTGIIAYINEDLPKRLQGSPRSTRLWKEGTQNVRKGVENLRDAIKALADARRIAAESERDVAVIRAKMKVRLAKADLKRMEILYKIGDVVDHEKLRIGTFPPRLECAIAEIYMQFEAKQYDMLSRRGDVRPALAEQGGPRGRESHRGLGPGAEDADSDDDDEVGRVIASVGSPATRKELRTFVRQALSGDLRCHPLAPCVRFIFLQGKETEGLSREEAIRAAVLTALSYLRQPRASWPREIVATYMDLLREHTAAMEAKKKKEERDQINHEHESFFGGGGLGNPTL